MSDRLIEQNQLPNTEINEEKDIPAGFTRREYWQRISDRARMVSKSELRPDLPRTNSSFFRRLLLGYPRPKFGPPFWTITGILSLAVNLILIVVLISLAQQVFNIKSALQNQLIGGLYNNFVLMDQASIRATIPVNAMVPAKFDLPIDTDTTVTLNNDVLMKGARVSSLKTGGLTITNAPADIVLPAGTKLPIHLSLTVPVDQQIPVNLNVNVNIPLNQTDLHTPFVGLQNVVSPYYGILTAAPTTLEQAVCGLNGSDLCKWIVP